MSTWIRDMFKEEKPIIAMVHFPPLPGAPLYDTTNGMKMIVRSLSQDLAVLQDGGVDGVMFCNEGDRPYLIDVGPETVAAMACGIGQLKSEIQVPFGVDVLWDPEAAIAIAAVTGASFVREVFTGLFASDMGLWNPRCGAVLRKRREIGAEDVRLLFNINAEFATSLDCRPLAQLAKSVVFSSLAEAICVSGPMTGEEASPEALQSVKDVVKEVPVFANTGVCTHNVARQLKVADAAVVGTALKKDGVTWNAVDPARVKEFMHEVREMRGGLARIDSTDNSVKPARRTF